MPCEHEVGGVWLCLDCYVDTFAIEFHEDDIEVAGICSVNTLLDPTVQYFDGAGKELMERKISIAFAFCIETRKTLSWHDVALEAAYLSFVQEFLAEGVFAAGVGARTWCPYELLTVEAGEKICSLAFKRVAFGFARTGHVLLIYQFHRPTPLIFKISG